MKYRVERVSSFKITKSNGKALAKLQSAKGGYRVVASQNQGPLKLFELKRKFQTLKINPDDVSAIVIFKNGKIQKEEFYYGSSFLSQSARFLSIDKNIAAVHITDKKGKIRKLLFN